ncbi:DUF3556 domain-containing protein [Aeromicrobium terrae]|uniref:DUF3556 domain-containing protein n=1 Tax=Aeromicrobium terrae TaxID=2498846 RepID=A0A5C8NHE3_9ACTN|nr:DUF3556 domain-containing protein [Aeromicrobium terrae]TXL60708.1 DUF3556 domain-containing protein [Aeromicrobium terrae]
MPFLTPIAPDIAPEDFVRRPFLERIRITSTFWAENGFGTPRMIHMIYLLKLVVLYSLGGLLVISATSDVGGLGSFTSWWDEPIVYQKVVLWTLLIEAMALGGTWGPLCGRFKPMTGGVRYWLRPGTIRMAPWGDKVPGTGGDTRTLLDVALYAALLGSLVLALVLPGVANSDLTAMEPDSTGGLVRDWAMILPVVLLILNGLRDKVVFLSARSEQYMPALIFSATLGYVDMIIAFKLLIVIIWMGAGFSKFGHHFTNVVPPMISNAPFNPSKKLRKAHYRDFPNDLRPSGLAWFMAHIGGTSIELIVPLVLLFTTTPEIALVAALIMVVFHAFIISTFPLAVPLEWNVAYGLIAMILFVGLGNDDGYYIGDFSNGWLLALIVAALLFFPVLGNLRPDLVSFLPSMRQYAGNWASATWAFAPGAEERLNELDTPARLQVEQLQEAMKLDRDAADMTMQLTLGWRSLHSQGPGLFSVLMHTLGDDINRYTIREAEFAANVILGWNFGDGHIHDERLIAAIQRRLHFKPGEFVVAYVESRPVNKPTQEYRVIDAALGIVERGTWQVTDAIAQQPWLPNGPIDLQVEWRHSNYVPGTFRIDAAPAEQTPASSA